MESMKDLLSLDDRAVQMLLRELEVEELALALKGEPDEVKELFARNMSDRGLLEVNTEGVMLGDEGHTSTKERVLQVAKTLQG